MLSLEDSWVWDFWTADDGKRFHLFFLRAPRSIGDEALRHRNARIGHAISSDLEHWHVLDDVLGPGRTGDFDETAAWTGSVVQGDDGVWRMFYTGSRFLEDWPTSANVETIGVATSADLLTWTKRPQTTVGSDARWYERLDDGEWREEAWRDPWVFREADGWHMLFTARGKYGPADDRGVVGHATSIDLETWHVQEPFLGPGLGFGHLEVPQLLTAPNGSQSVLFCCPRPDLAQRNRDRPFGGIWAIPIDASGAAADEAELLTSERYYSGRIVYDRAGEPQLLMVDNYDADGFIGTISDPVPVRFDERGVPVLPERYQPTT